MSVDLEDKPGAIYDDNKPAWKTNLHDDDLEKSFEAPDASDENLPDGHPSKSKKELSASDLRDKEKNPATDLKNESDNEEAASFYKNTDKKRRSFRSRISRKQAGIGVAIAGSLISAFTVITLQAPNLIINNLKEMLLDRMSTVQMHHSRRYRQKKLGEIKNYFSKNGRMGQKIVNEMRADGYEVVFVDNQIKSIKPPNGEFLINEAVGDHIDEYMNVKHPFRTARWKTKRMNALYANFSVSRTSVVDANKSRAGPDGEDLDPKQTVNSRSAKEILDGDDEQIEVLRSDVTSEETDPDAKTADEARREEINSQSSDIGDNLKQFKERLINEGVDISELSDDDLAKVLSEAGDGFTGDLGNLIKNAVDSKSIGGKITDGVGNVLKPLDILDRVCTIRRRIAAAKMLARAARSASLIRYAMLFINAADDTRRGNADPKLVNELMKRVTAEDVNGNAIGASPGFGYLMKSKFSKSRNDASRSSVAVDGKLTGIPGGISDTIDRVPGMETGCPYIQNPLIQVGAGVGSIALGFFTGGSSTTATTLASQGVRAALREVIETTITKTVLKKVLLGVATEAVKELSFEGVMLLTEMYVQRNLNLPFTGQEKGGQLGDILVGGTGAANKQRSLAAGMVPATTQQYAQAKNEYIAWRNDELKTMSFKDRMFNMEDTRSLAFNMATLVPSGATDAVQKSSDSTIAMASTALNPAKIMQSAFNLLTSKTGVSASDDIPFDEYVINGGSNDGTSLATDTAGNLQMIMRSDIEAINPESNIEELKTSEDIDSSTLEPKSEAFVKHVENCVVSADILTRIEKNEFDCMANEPKTKKFKAHLAYLDLIDGLEAEFFPEEINKGIDAGSASTPLNNKVFVVGDSLTVGMRDTGELVPKLQTAGWQATKVEATQGDTVEDAIPKVEADRAQVSSAGTVVVMLGTNTSTNFNTKIKDMVNKIKSINPTANIYWMNAKTDVSNYNEINAAIQTESQILKYTVIDWAGEYTKNKALYPTAGDGIHHTAAGYKAKSTYLVGVLGSPKAGVSQGLTWPLEQSKGDVERNLGACLKQAEKYVCDADHGYKAHDLFAKPGTKVLAAAEGTVIKSKNGTCGHGFGSAFTVQVYNQASNTTYFYQHMDPNVGGVAVGTVLKPGDPIGVVGSSEAACKTSPHLHIDAYTGRGRQACSRQGCPDSVRSSFKDISKELYKGYEVLR